MEQEFKERLKKAFLEAQDEPEENDTSETNDLEMLLVATQATIAEANLADEIGDGKYMLALETMKECDKYRNRLKEMLKKAIKEELK